MIDARGFYATTERFAEADDVLRAAPEEVLEQACLDTYSYVLTLAHDPKFDVPALACALRSQSMRPRCGRTTRDPGTGSQPTD